MPGQGVEQVRLGDTRDVIEGRLGPPTVERDGRAYYDTSTPGLVITYDASDAVEMIEIPYAGTPGKEVTLNGVQLTYRAMDEVLHDLGAAGFTGHPSDIGHDFSEGFAIWSMDSLSLSDVDSAAKPDDEGQVVEGVAVGTPAYFGL